MSGQDTIRIQGLSAFGYHGVLAEERANGQRFVVDVALTLSTRSAGESDDLTRTVDYSAVAEAALAVVTGEPRNLIETVAEQIARAALAYDQVETVTVTVHKPDAPIAAEFSDVSVQVVRSR